MKRSSRCSAFTLIEMITVMAVIVILASLVLSVNSLVQKKSATSKAKAEIEAITLLLENYKADNGDYPREIGKTESDGSSETLDPRKHGAPATTHLDKYRTASRVLYVALSGDADFDGKPDAKQKTYSTEFFRPERLKFDNPSSSSRKVEYIQDPFGNCYGYSTAGAKVEEDYREALRVDPSKAERPTGKALQGFNPTFDLWSTAGTNIQAGAPTDSDRNRWIKNW